jgi:phage gp29-like protein
MMIEFQKATDGDPDSFALMIDWCERSQSKAILGGTLTSQADGKTSTNALGEVHNEVRKDLRDADVRQIAATLSRDVVYSIAALNGLAPNGPRRAPQFKFDNEETEDITVYSEALPPLLQTGMKIPRKWAQERLGIPEPEEDDDDLLHAPAVTAKPAPQEEPAAAGQAAANAQMGNPASPSDPPELQARRASTEVSPDMDVWLGKIRALVEHSTTLEQIRDGLLDLAPDMTLDQYAAAMRQALASAALAGRFEILQEAGGA